MRSDRICRSMGLFSSERSIGPKSAIPHVPTLFLPESNSTFGARICSHSRASLHRYEARSELGITRNIDLRPQQDFLVSWFPTAWWGWKLCMGNKHPLSTGRLEDTKSGPFDLPLLNGCFKQSIQGLSNGTRNVFKHFGEPTMSTLL
jgi:hypothetical protein